MTSSTVHPWIESDRADCAIFSPDKDSPWDDDQEKLVVPKKQHRQLKYSFTRNSNLSPRGTKSSLTAGFRQSTSVAVLDSAVPVLKASDIRKTILNRELAPKLSQAILREHHANKPPARLLVVKRGRGDTDEPTYGHDRQQIQGRERTTESSPVEDDSAWYLKTHHPDVW